MKYQNTLLWMIALIWILALLAAGSGLFWKAEGQAFEFETLRGETVLINGRGLYYYDSFSVVAQAQAQDLVTLVVGLPLLGVSVWMARRSGLQRSSLRRSELRGQLLLSGTLGYFLYTYTSLAFGAAFNPLFLLYVALFSLSLFAFILSLLTIDLEALPGRFSEKLPRRGIASVLFFAGAFLTLAWLGRILPALLQNQPPFGLEANTTLFIQVMDLGLVVPLALLSGILLLQRSAWGYLLASVAVMKFLTMGAAVSAMGINMVLVGAEVSPVELVVFPALTLVNATMAIALLKNVRPRAEAGVRPAEM